MWQSWSCVSDWAVHHFVCQSHKHQQRRGSINVTLEYSKEQLTFSSIEVQYKYHFTSQHLIDSWQDKEMTGFSLSWFLKDSNGSRLTEVTPDLTSEWKHLEVDIPKYQNPFLETVVKLASNARLSNMSTDDVIKKVMQKKKALITTGLFDYTSICSGGQVKQDHQSKIFGNINLGLTMKETEIITEEEDLKTGFMLYSSLISCSESVALYQFLHNHEAARGL